MAKNTKSKISFGDILKGKFLVEDNASRSWTFLLFILGLALLSIVSSHLVEEKVIKMNALQEQVSELNAQYANIHKDLMRGQIKSEVVKTVFADSLKLSENQPYKIISKEKTTEEK